MSDQSVFELLERVGALITESHVVYTSGRHGSAYVNKDALYLHPRETALVCAELVRPFAADMVDVVVGPTIGGVILAQWGAWHLNQRRASGETLAAYAEEEGEDKQRVFRRGYDEQVRGKRVVIVEDILNTGGSARKVVDAVRHLDATIIGMSVLCNRGGVTGEDLGGVDLYALTEISLESWDASECPLCRSGVPLNTTIGKGRMLLTRHE
jgi:orotate phosphoribosyltransferase